MRRRIVLIVAAVLLALAGTAALWQYVSGADARALAGKEAVDVLVAADAIPAGTDFEEAQRQGLVETVGFPRGAVPVGAFADAGQAAGLVTSRAIEPHELLLATNLGPRGVAAPVTGGLTVPAGKVALPVSLQHFANSADWAAYLQPGAEIAIFETFTSAGAAGTPAIPRGDGLALEDGNTQVTRLLLDRVTVLAVAGAEAETPGTALVLAVDQQQAEKVVLGLSSGVALYPVLLTGDQVLAPSPGTANSRLFDTPRDCAVTLLVCNDRPSIDVLSSAIGGADTVEHLADLRRHLTAHPDDLVVIGPDIDLAAAAEFTAAARLGQPALGVLLVRNRVDTGVLTQALHAGFRAVLTVQETQRLGQACAASRELSDGVRRAAGMAPTTTGASRGRTITIFSGKGGVGKSTIATDVGVALVQSGVRTCLVDLDLAFGDVAVMLGLLPLRTLTDAVPMAANLDAAGAAALVTPHSSGLHVILAPAEPRGAEDISADLVSKLLPLLTDLYDVVLVDTPPAFTEDVLAALDASDEVILITTPEVPSIKNLKLTLQTLNLLGYPADRRRIVLNRADPHLGIAAADVAAMIGVDVQVEVPADRAVPISINHGVPIVLEQPKHPVSRAIRLLAAAVRGGAPQPAPAMARGLARHGANRRGLLRRKESAR